MNASVIEAVRGLGSRTSAALYNIAGSVENVPAADHYHWNIAFSSLDGGTIEALRTEMKSALGSKCQSIYVITLTDPASAGPMRNAIAKARSEVLEGRAYPRVNPELADSSLLTLYVGSSANTVLRIYQHLGSGPKATYALHLSAWARPLPGGIDIDVFTYTGLDAKVLLVLEDQLSADLRPALGRRGAR